MNAQTNKQMKGFTIIEVVLVLAIAGLIFLMVFIALPALQRSQRDQARKNDVSTVASAVTSYSSNNRGAFPDVDKLDGYLDDLSDNSTDDSGNPNVTIVLNATDGQKINPDDTEIRVVKGVVCGDENDTTGSVVKRGTARQFSVVTRLESGNGQYYCQTS